MSFEKCTCAHCGQHVEYPSEGRGATIPCPTCQYPVTLMPAGPKMPTSSIETPPAPLIPAPSFSPQVYFPEVEIPLPSVAPKPAETMTVASKNLYLQFMELTAVTIARKTRLGDTPLHRAAKNGITRAIPRHLLTPELFMDRNSAGETPLHIAARNGYLHQVPSQFLTQETVTIADATGETPLHIAVSSGQFCRLPRRLLIAELLCLPTNNATANTVLHLLAESRRVDQIPRSCITPEIWNRPNGEGLTPRNYYERAMEMLQMKNGGESWRTKPLTDKQATKLRYFGCTWDQGVTRGQASEAIDECARAFPDLEESYYSRPATQEQLDALKTYLEPEGEEPDDYAKGETLTYGEAKDLLGDCDMQQRQEQEEKELAACGPPTETQIKALRDSGFKVERNSHLTAGDLEAFLKLEGLPPRQEDLDLFKRHRLKFHQGDAFAAYGLAVLIRQLEEMAAQSQGYVNIVNACTAAMGDPAYLSATVTFDDDLGEVSFAWPRNQLHKWFQCGFA